MSREGVEHLSDALQEKIDYFRKEYTLTYAEVLGVLAIIQTIMCQEAIEEGDNPESSTDDDEEESRP